MTTFVKFSMNGELVGVVKPKDIPPHVEPLPTFSLRIHDRDLAAIQRIDRDSTSDGIKSIRMQAGDREFLGYIEGTDHDGVVCSVQIRMTRSS